MTKRYQTPHSRLLRNATSQILDLEPLSREVILTALNCVMAGYLDAMEDEADDEMSALYDTAVRLSAAFAPPEERPR